MQDVILEEAIKGYVKERSEGNYSLVIRGLFCSYVKNELLYYVKAEGDEKYKYFDDTPWTLKGSDGKEYLVTYSSSEALGEYEKDGVGLHTRLIFDNVIYGDKIEGLVLDIDKSDSLVVPKEYLKQIIKAYDILKSM